MLSKTLSYLSLVLITAFIINGVISGLFTNSFAQIQQSQTLQQQPQLQGQTNETSPIQDPHSLQGSFFTIDNMTFSHHTASVNGIQLHYVIGGHGDPQFCCMDGRKHGMHGTK